MLSKLACGVFMANIMTTNTTYPAPTNAESSSCVPEPVPMPSVGNNGCGEFSASAVLWGGAAPRPRKAELSECNRQGNVWFQGEWVITVCFFCFLL